MQSLLSLFALVTVWHWAEVRTQYVRQFEANSASLDEALVSLALRDSTPDRYRTEEYFTAWFHNGKTLNGKTMEADRGPLAALPCLMQGENKAVGPRVTQWAWSTCGGSSDLIVVGNITVSPDPIKLPGTLTVSVAAKIKQDIPDPIQAQLTIRKKLGILWVTIPCIDNVGSCTYTGICEMLDKVTCPAPVVHIGQNCRCPIKQSDGFYMQPSGFVINTGGDIPTGDYQIEAKASHNGQPITCINISFTIEH